MGEFALCFGKVFAFDSLLLLPRELCQWLRGRLISPFIRAETINGAISHVPSNQLSSVGATLIAASEAFEALLEALEEENKPLLSCLLQFCAGAVSRFDEANGKSKEGLSIIWMTCASSILADNAASFDSLITLDALIRIRWSVYQKLRVTEDPVPEFINSPRSTTCASLLHLPDGNVPSLIYSVVFAINQHNRSFDPR